MQIKVAIMCINAIILPYDYRSSVTQQFVLETFDNAGIQLFMFGLGVYSIQNESLI